ncbi:MAG: hypothetical protein Q9207_005342, partial [Kuettlingeria erythrocarpa]
MWSISTFTVVACLLCKTLAQGFGPGFSQANGKTKLLASSFGDPGVEQTFDYVVIGGGTAGLTVAARLAEDRELSVAVVEAGSFYEITGAGNQTQIPAYESLYLSAPPTIEWETFTTPQMQLNKRSARNGMVYQRGTAGSHQAWADAVGDSAYEFEKLLPFFKKSVNFAAPNIDVRGGPAIPYQSSACDPADGPLHVAYWNDYLEASPYIRNALQEAGFRETDGIESGSLLGFAQWPATVDPDAMVRDSSETSFGRQAIESTTLRFYLASTAKKILFSGKKATGFMVETAGMTYKLKARKELVLAAGAFRTPQLLMVSGIGPAEQLSALDIPMVSELPGVGQELWDQPSFYTVFPVNVTTLNQLFSNATYLAEASQAYVNAHTGPLSIFSGNYLAWERLPNSSFSRLSPSAQADLNAYPPDWPDMQYTPTPLGPILPNDTGNYISLAMTMQKTTSRGDVRINSTDTAANPLVNVNWLATSTDQQLAVQGIRRARAIQSHFGAVKSGPEIAPGEAVTTDAQILAYLRETVITIHRAAGTCKMGRADDPKAVVDSHGRLLGGLQGLRVVDASAIPVLPPGQTMATV